MCLLDCMKYSTLDSDPFTWWSLSGDNEVLYERIVVCLSQEQLCYSTKYVIHWNWDIKTFKLIVWACQYTTTLLYLLFAVPPTSLIRRVIFMDDGLLRTSTGCASPALSLRLYIVWLNITVIARGLRIH